METLRSSLSGGRSFSAGPVTIIAAPSGVTRGAGLLVVEGRVDNPGDFRAGISSGDLMPNDAGFLLGLIRRHGVEGLARIRGAFTCACWDEQAGHLLFAAEPLGRRTVFHTRIDGLLVFSSSLRILLGLPGVSREIEEPYLAALMSDVIPEPDATLYAAIRRVPPPARWPSAGTGRRPFENIGSRTSAGASVTRATRPMWKKRAPCWTRSWSGSSTAPGRWSAT